MIFFFSGLRGGNLIFSFWCHQWWPLPVTNHISVPDATAVLAFAKMDTTAVARKKPSGNPPYTFLSTKPYLADVFWKASPLNGAFWREIMTSLFLLMLLDLEHWVHCVNWKKSRVRTVHPLPMGDYKSLDKWVNWMCFNGLLFKAISR